MWINCRFGFKQKATLKKKKKKKSNNEYKQNVGKKKSRNLIFINKMS